MATKCSYCGGSIPKNAETCPHCGAQNPSAADTSAPEEFVPRTIEELLAFCDARNMPLEKMRFFIGVDCREPRAFGIYRDSCGNFVVYKNKADGSRSVRYQGPDEAYAVREILEKLRFEIQLRKNSAENAGVASRQRTAGQKISTILTAAFIIIGLIVTIYHSCTDPRRGYYYYDHDYYYSYAGEWYLYDLFDHEWYLTDPDDEFSQNFNEYWQGDEYDSARIPADFTQSDFYTSDSDDWDYDYGGWDSSDTDWNSDW